MKLFARWSFALLTCVLVGTSSAQISGSKPGLQPYMPSRIEWLALVVNADLRQEATVDNPFSVSIVSSDHETVLIFVRYHSNVNRTIMNEHIDTAREVIRIRANGYGWSNWVKIKERIELVK